MSIQQSENNSTKRIEMTDSESVDTWNNEKVQCWLKKSNFEIQKAFSHFDGSMLRQLFDTRCKEPQAFHRTVMAATRDNLKLAELALFIANLELLFK